MAADIPGDTSNHPIGLEPVYDSWAVNEPVLFYEGQAEIDQSGEVRKGIGVVELTWLPVPRLRFSFEQSDRLELGEARIRIPSSPDPLRVCITSLSHSSAGAGPLSGFLVEPVELGSQIVPLSHVLFHLPNFHAFIGSSICSATEPRRVRAARATIEADGWRIVVDCQPEFDQEFWQHLSDEGGFAITHIGRLERADAKPFTGEDALRLVEPLAYFFTFCRGLWVSPILLCGFDADGDKRWEYWSTGRIGRHQRLHSWFDDHSVEGLARAWPGFLRRSKDAVWGPTMRDAVKWYTEANTGAGGIEGSIILAFAAFELLAWTLLVEDRKVLSPVGFERLWASDKLRLLLSACDLPLSIPVSLTELLDSAKRKRWVDAAHALTELRNGLVHPKSRKRGRGVVSADTLFDAWCLCLHLLELILLRIVGYDGTFANRVKKARFQREQIERVPWATSDT